MSVLGCEVIDTIPPGDITTYQEKQLKSRKHTTRRQTDEEKWRDIYGLLFPNEKMPSPCKSFHNCPSHLTRADSLIGGQIPSLPRIWGQHSPSPT